MMKPKLGRPFKLSPEMAEMIKECIEDGMTLTDTCDALEISRNTLTRWRKQNIAINNIVKKAQAFAIKERLAVVRKASLDVWQAAAWWLERRHPDKWGRVEPGTLAARRAEQEKAHEISREGKDLRLALGLLETAPQSDVDNAMAKVRMDNMRRQLFGPCAPMEPRIVEVNSEQIKEENEPRENSEGSQADT